MTLASQAWRGIAAFAGADTLELISLREVLGMGRFNSSSTRVVPVFDALMDRDPTGRSWVEKILRLGSRIEAVPALPLGLHLVNGHERWWGKNEASLPAPLGLLLALARGITKEQVDASGDKGDVLANRLGLAHKDPVLVQKAVTALQAGKRGRSWYVLEGPSRPDALLELPETVVVVEGKRTEPECTTTTRWMATRSQMLRHMDAALERYPGKRVLGLLIVEGEEPAPNTPSRHWQTQADNQVQTIMLEGSLPHRSVEERQRIVEGFLGVTTWQAVCNACALGWPPRREPSA